MHLLLASALLATACLQRDGGTRAGGGEVPLRYRLEARPSYVAGRPVPVVFTLENRSGEVLRVLRWYTPLEGLMGAILEVSRGGAALPYRGRMVKRRPPGPEDYVRLEPGGSVSATFDLATGYDLSVPGDYRVRFGGRIHDVAREGEPVPSPERPRAAVATGEAAAFRVVPAG